MLAILPVCISRVYITQEKYLCCRTHKTRAVGFERFLLPCQFIHNSPQALLFLILSMFPSIAKFTPKPRRHQRISTEQPAKMIRIPAHRKKCIGAKSAPELDEDSVV